jgi:hypothetical protein
MSKFLMYDIPFVFYDRSSCRSSMLDSVIAEANHDVDVTLRRRRNTDVPIDDPVISDVDKRVSVVQGSTEAVAST